MSVTYSRLFYFEIDEYITTNMDFTAAIYIEIPIIKIYTSDSGIAISDVTGLSSAISSTSASGTAHGERISFALTDTHSGSKWYHLGRISYDAFNFLAENTKIEINACYNSDSVSDLQQALYTILFKTTNG